MYNVSIGPSKIVAKTRRGISQNLERLENLRELTRRPFEPEETELSNGPKPVFHTNGKKIWNGRQQDSLSPQHEELIKFISDSWNKIFKEYETDSIEDAEQFSSTITSGSIIYYEEQEPKACLQDFKPFDLESWWGKRLFNNITKSIP